ncbi:MAG: LysR family transcriptional regulator [Roseibium sp.]|uniref:LysR substrate-binding domain-containing protein n=1 Tax=Roseibium sp. TaxID=1936156 RepID=UPI00261BC6D2|nr:LysR substrate-binding domain-containing protein [Roseibium sp.]MCV0428068.1 LysR family transcriptional regulator [Roseibium sp.]
MENLDSDLLRTFIAVADAGSVTDGAQRIYRSQSAASIQIKRLEAVLGRKVFERHGRGVMLTETGRRLLPVAKSVTERLDNALREIASDGLRGKLRLGLPDDHGRDRLARIVAAFTQSHPLVELEVTCALSASFPDALARRQLDLAVYEVAMPSAGEELLVEDPTCWAASAYRDFNSSEPLPVALFDHACWWRDAALRSLEQMERAYRVVYSSQSVSGVIAAVEAGVAVGLLGRSSLREGLVVLDEAEGFGPAPVSKLVLGISEEAVSESVNAMAAAIRTEFRH